MYTPFSIAWYHLTTSHHFHYQSIHLSSPAQPSQSSFGPYKLAHAPPLSQPLKSSSINYRV
ncbi:hypothetical protein BGZ63DRAFT_380506, partial [Mariannaea sp. PMI_226]